MPPFFRPSRRSFIGAIGAGITLGAVPDLLALDSYQSGLSRPGGSPLLVHGRVTGGGRPLGRVVVSDGHRVAVTDKEGRYQLEVDRNVPRVFVSTPAGYALPVSRHGTLALHRVLPPGESRLDFALDQLHHDDTRHAFVALADPQTLDAEDMTLFHTTTVPAVRREIEALGDRELFGVTVGDILWDDLTLYREYERAVTRLGVPFAQVVGNHDLDQAADTNAGSTVTFSRHFGPTWYSFNRGAVHYVVLNNVYWYGDDYVGHLPREQLAWLRQDLSLVEAGASVIVFTHIPLSSTTVARNSFYGDAPMTMTNAAALWHALEPYDVHLITGHTHEMEHSDHGPRAHEHNLATACGAWWTGPVCTDGSPSGFGVYEVDGSDVRWRYQATGRPAEERLAVYARGSEPLAPTEFVANVWDWDPRWTVTWYEGADRRGAMSARLGRDPISVRLHDGPARPPKHPWAEPLMTGHLFYAAVAADHGPITVEAVDRFGVTWTAGPTPVVSG